MSVRESTLVQSELEPFRRELTRYCYRMLGSGFEAEDAVQETMLRAWRNADKFEGRSSVRSWLYRIATNVCIDMQRNVQRRARPMEMGPSSPPVESHLGPTLPEALWITPIADASVAPEGADPAEVAQYRESIRLAFVAALQHLPARQRAALILCEVLRWQASEAAELLDTSVAAINSALQRARATLSAVTRRGASPTPSTARTASSWRATSTPSSATTSSGWSRCCARMPCSRCPRSPCGSRGRRTSGAGWSSPVRASAGARAWWPPPPTAVPPSASTAVTPRGGYAPWALQVLEISAGKITGMTFFLDLLDPERLFPSFGLPLHLDD